MEEENRICLRDNYAVSSLEWIMQDNEGFLHELRVSTGIFTLAEKNSSA